MQQYVSLGSALDASFKTFQRLHTVPKTAL